MAEWKPGRHYSAWDKKAGRVKDVRNRQDAETKRWQKVQPPRAVAAHRAVGVVAADARAQDEAAGERGQAAHHVHGAGPGKVDRARVEQQVRRLGPAAGAAQQGELG